MKAQDLKGTLTEYVKELAEATDAAKLTEVMQNYLEMCAKLHKYSPQNMLLIFTAKPDATMVAGYTKWPSMGRYVRKGEKGIPILAPLIVKQKDKVDEKALIGFKVVYVFDQSQTEGEDIPEPAWKSLGQDKVLADKLVKFAEDNSITVQFKELPGDLQGYSAGGVIVISQNAGTKTIIHEIAHELMHKQGMDRPTTKTLVELEAEGVAYVVGRHFGLADLESPNYVALHGATSEMIMEHMENIHAAATKIISAIE